mmetsp:Transcript_14257/g.40401  ORF Transcript_14257/g.40401 Transcript_14257/m.40401 type:complete len:252 (+) Transcript_14257:249-1004(+)|eukprot:CAMPEP_0117653998 /NCGR_PEP_ID=MMETSP0804-20121206/3505_1 /TAXON_ID=1074897 /ORGANISM="Tetraselmis astigmatica, Strain CCMP880" /LENGTH=251 /DNA_ID=CAMNT_0005460241 /DNA_START=252 /DNA_END=1010 /DNA_ORIENTATION=-
MAASNPRTIAVLFSSVGSGMGDVGKFCVVQGLRKTGVVIKPVALSAPLTEGSDKQITVDVTYEAGKAQVSDAFGSLPSLPRIDITSQEAQSKIEDELQGCDAVIACLGSRQPSKKTRWCALGAEKIVAAMKSAGVERIVNLSSMGIGEDFQPWNFLKYFWWLFLRTVIPSALSDLTAMEKVITTSGLDYLQVMCMGISPEEPPRGSWHLLEKRGDGKLAMTVSKEDVAAFMLSEAITPKHSKARVTIGYKV